jgi:toxin ParE1/3/4
VKRAALRPAAEADLIERTRYYRRAGGLPLGEQFFDAAIAALRSVEKMPGLGSPRVGELIGLDGLRRVGVEGFPCGWLYLERARSLDVVRLLADRQDLGVALAEPDDDL